MSDEFGPLKLVFSRPAAIRPKLSVQQLEIQNLAAAVLNSGKRPRSVAYALRRLSEAAVIRIARNVSFKEGCCRNGTPQVRNFA